LGDKAQPNVASVDIAKQFPLWLKTPTFPKSGSKNIFQLKKKRLHPNEIQLFDVASCLIVTCFKG